MIETNLDMENISLCKNSSENIEDNLKNVLNHYNPSVRMVHVPKLSDGSCGFHLTRSKWDPYPWVSQVDSESPAEMTGVKSGDCVLEVNGEDVLGLRITEVANLVRSKCDHVSLLLWTTGLDQKCNPESLCCGPMPLNLERLSASVSTILAAMECPVCLDTIPPPCIQCQNGHLVCSRCSIRSEKCPVCREKYSPGRSLIAEQVFNSITEAFKLNENETKLHEKLFGIKKCHKVKNEIIENFYEKPLKSHTHSFLARIMGKSNSVDNLSMNKKEIFMKEENMELSVKRKSLSLSNNEIFCPDTKISINRCPSLRKFNNNEYLGTKRPKSCQNSSEKLNRDFEDVVQIRVPQFSHLNQIQFSCPADHECDGKILGKNLIKHILEEHKMPVITFGTSSAEISLPPRAPIENACLILNLDNFQFWIKLIQEENGDIFISSLIQANKELSLNYLLEIKIINLEKPKILRRELIARNEIFDLENTSWKEIYENRKGISYSRDSLKATFNSDNILLRAEIKCIIEDI